MLYQAYVEKLAKWRRRFDRIWRFRLLILAAFLTFLAGVGALLGVGGIVYDVQVPVSAVYGEEFLPEAKSVFGKAAFEYRAVGEEEWTREKPILVGSYECRAVGVSVAKTDRPGQSFSYEILPAPIEVRVDATSLKYGEELPFAADLFYGDTLSVGSYASEGKDGTLTVRADSESVCIRNAAGEDVTFCYAIETAEKSIRDVSRSILIRTATNSYVYDGAPHADESLEIAGDGLVEGQRVEADFPSITDAGSVQNVAQNVRVVDGDGNDVTAHYSIGFEVGTLSVTRRPISVKTATEEVIYDGREHIYAEASLVVDAGELAAGQRFVQTGTLAALSTGVYANRPAIAIFEGGEDRTENYELSVQYGTVTVLPRPITLTMPSDEFIYDGKVHTYTRYGLEGTLAEGDEIRLSNALSASAAGTYTSAPRVSVYNGSDNETGNYEITVVDGTVTIKKRPITLTMPSEEFFYDGKVHTYTEYGLGGTPAEGHEIRLSNTLSVSEAGRYTSTPRVSVYSGSVNETGNYEITVVDGTVLIKQRTLRIRTDESSWGYDGALHENRGYTVEESAEAGYGLLEGHGIEVAEAASIRDAGSILNRLVFAVEDANGNDVTKNYADLTAAGGNVAYGTLEVTARPITVQTDSVTRAYNAEPLHSEAYEVTSEEQLVEGHRLVAQGAQITAVGERENVFTDLKIEDAEGNSIPLGNYVITWDNGTLTVTRRPIRITTKDYTWIYDGKAHDGLENTNRGDFGFTVENAEGEGLVAGHTALATVDDGATVMTVKNSGTLNHLSFRIEDAGGNDVTRNYADLTEAGGNVTYGTLTVAKRALSVQTESDAFNYDGTTHSYGAETLSCIAGTSLAEGDAFVITGGAYEFMTVQTVQNAPTIEIRAGGEDRTENYDDPTWQYGTIAISARPVYVTTESGEWVYDGTAHENRGFKIAERTEGTKGTGVVAGHTINSGSAVTGAPSVTLVSETGAENKLTFNFRITAGETEVTKNYEFRYTFGTLTITKRPITVTTQTKAWTYDGQVHTFSEKNAGFTFTANGEGVGLVEGEEIAADREQGIASVINVADSGKTNQFEVTITKGGVSTAENYQITYNYAGKLTIDKREITITADEAQTWVYDGTAHSYTEFTYNKQGGEAGKENGLVDGEIVALVKDSEVKITDVGDCENEFIVTITKRDGTLGDSTGNYEIAYVFAKLRVTQRPIRITTQTKAWTYDGQAHSYAEKNAGFTFTANGEGVGLVEGEEIAAKADTVPTVTNVADSGKTNQFEVTITKQNGTIGDSTANYEITYDYEGATLTIEKRPITVTTQTKAWTYDGQAHSYAEKNAGFTFTANGEGVGLVEGEEIAADRGQGIASVINVADSGKTNQFEVTITKGGVSTAENYQITYNYAGKLTIEQRKITLTTATHTWVYDGMVHSDDTVTCNGREGNEGLVDGQTFTPTTTSHPSFCNVFDEKNGNEGNNTVQFDWTVTATINGEQVKVGDSEDSKTSNYIVKEIVQGTLTITPRPLTIKTATEEWVYDGDSHSNDKVSCVAGLVDGQTFTPTTTSHPSFCNVGDEKNGNEGNNTVQFDWTVTVKADGQKVGGSDMLNSNYTITTVYGTLKITARPIYLKTPNGTWVYDGTAHDTWSVREGDEDPTVVPAKNGEGVSGLVKSKTHTHTLAVDTYTQFINYQRGGYSNKITYRIEDETKNDVTENYVDFNDSKNDYIEYGQVTIEQRPITVTTQSQTWTYDGDPHSYAEKDEGFTFTAYGKDVGLVEGEEIAADETKPIASITDVLLTDPGQWNVGSVQNKFEVSITKKDGTIGDSTNNYAITYEYEGTLTIEQRKITITTPTHEDWVYDGKAHFDADFAWNSEGEPNDNEGLLTSEIINLAVPNSYPTVTNVLRDEGGAVTGVTNTLQVLIAKADGKTPSTTNYKITYVYGTLKINPRPVTVGSDSKTWIHDGEEHFWDAGLSLNEIGKENEGVVGGQTIKLKNYPTVTEITDKMSDGRYSEVGYEPNKFDGVTILSDGTDVTANYTVTISEEWGKLRVKSPITVYLYAQSKVYDGKPLTLDLSQSNAYEIVQAPPEIWAHPEAIVITGVSGFTAVQQLTLDNFRKTISASVDATKAGIDVGENRFDFIDENAYSEQPDAVIPLLEVTPAKITVTTGSKVGNRKDGALKDETFVVSGAWDDATFEIECVITGALDPTEESAKNTLSDGNIHIYLRGKKGDGEVTKNFEITIVAGTLSWEKDENDPPAPSAPTSSEALPAAENTRKKV